MLSKELKFNSEGQYVPNLPLFLYWLSSPCRKC